MARDDLELESVEITNPTSDDFTWRYNGSPYTIKAGEKRAFAKPVAYHLAKHLSTKMVENEVTVNKKDLENPNAAIHVKIAQLNTYDTHERRIALYQIFGDEKRVTDLITRYPFKGFIGDMEAYKSFVEKAQKEATK